MCAACCNVRFAAHVLTCYIMTCNFNSRVYVTVGKRMCALSSHFIAFGLKYFVKKVICTHSILVKHVLFRQRYLILWPPTGWNLNERHEWITKEKWKNKSRCWGVCRQVYTGGSKYRWYRLCGVRLKGAVWTRFLEMGRSSRYPWVPAEYAWGGF